MKKIIIYIAAFLIVLSVFCIIMYIKSDYRAMKRLSDNYQVVPDTQGGIAKWHLYIGTHEGDDRFFTIYDNGGVIGGEEHPWIVGTVEKADNKKMIISVDEEIFDSVESDFESENGKLIIYYTIKGDILNITNGGSSMIFQRQVFATN